MALLPGPEAGAEEDAELIPARRVAVSEILPLTMVGNQVELCAAPTNCALPLSPIFIKSEAAAACQLEAGYSEKVEKYFFLYEKKFRFNC